MLNKITAALVDDEYRSLDALKRVLCQYYSDKIEIIFTAISVKELMEKLEKNIKPEVLFLDIELPYESGFDALERINEKFPEYSDTLYVIFVTGFDHYAIQAIRFAAVDYILKPITIDEIEQAINKLISHRNKVGITLFSEAELKLLYDSVEKSKQMTFDEFKKIINVLYKFKKNSIRMNKHLPGTIYDDI